MRIRLVCPAPPGSRSGNRATARRWARLLRDLGHSTSIQNGYDGEVCEILIALHARRSAVAMAKFRRLHPDGVLIAAMTGTDLYHDLEHSPSARRSLELASRLVVLQEMGIAALPAEMRSKTRVILQSAVAPRVSSRRGVFEVAVAGHLRAVKDPFRAALAARALPAASRLRIVHAGKALTAAMAKRARDEMRRNPRYRWIGEIPPAAARRLIARSRALVLSSILEGGANVLSEAIVAGVPILASRIPGSVGILGRAYPGFFPVRNTEALTRLLNRLERDPAYRAALTAWVRKLQPLFSPAREREAWRSLIAELHSESSPSRS